MPPAAFPSIPQAETVTVPADSSLWDRISTWVSENKAVVYTIAGVAVVVTGAGAVYYVRSSGGTQVSLSCFPSAPSSALAPARGGTLAEVVACLLKFHCRAGIQRRAQTQQEREEETETGREGGGRRQDCRPAGSCHGIGQVKVGQSRVCQ